MASEEKTDTSFSSVPIWIVCPTKSNYSYSNYVNVFAMHEQHKANDNSLALCWNQRGLSTRRHGACLKQGSHQSQTHNKGMAQPASTLRLTDYGFCIDVKLPEASASLYMYRDDANTSYLAGLHVNPEHRRLGLGTFLQTHREDLARLLGASKICLKVLESSWMHTWYGRRGYVYMCRDSRDVTYVWMRKELYE